jgi:hemerythrin superfamily protein
MNILKLLGRDHQTIRALFDEFGKAGALSPEERSGLFERVRREILVHSQAEEEIFYPMLKAADGNGRTLVMKAMEEHRRISELLIQIARLKPGDSRFADKFETLLESMDRHIEEGEGAIFQFAEENCPAEQLEAAGEKLEERKRTIDRQIAA